MEDYSVLTIKIPVFNDDAVTDMGEIQCTDGIDSGFLQYIQGDYDYEDEDDSPKHLLRLIRRDVVVSSVSFKRHDMCAKCGGVREYKASMDCPSCYSLLTEDTRDSCMYNVLRFIDPVYSWLRRLMTRSH
jgi:hypothetical protein